MKFLILGVGIEKRYTGFSSVLTTTAELLILCLSMMSITGMENAKTVIMGILFPLLM